MQIKDDKNIKVLILTDDRIGTNNQAIGIANFINKDYKEHKLIYNSLIKLPNFIRAIFNLGITKQNKTDLLLLLKTYKPDIVISGGRRPAVISAWIKKVSLKLFNKDVKNIQLMNPNLNNSKFDLIVLPKHDFKNNNYPNKNNIVLTDFAPHKITSDFLNEQKIKWSKFFENYNNKLLHKPYISVIIGGSTKSTKFTNEIAYDLANKINTISKDNNASLLISTSRRTGDNQTKIIKDNITQPNYFYTPTDKDENPIFGLYSCADAIILTSESISMISEALSSNIPVFVYDNDNLTTQKHKRFLKNLYDKGYINNITDFTLTKKINNEKKAINSSELIAKEILNRFF